MRRVALALLLATGCATIQAHPFATAGIANTAIIVGASACALDCDDRAARDVSDGVLITELSLSSMMSLWVVGFITAYTQENH